MLKNMFINVMLCLLFVRPVLAREASSQIGFFLDFGASGVDGTVRGGSTMGLWMDNDPTLWNDPKLEAGSAGGVSFGYRYFFTENAALNTGLNITYKSFTINYPAMTADDLTFDISTTYLIVPVGLRLYSAIFFFVGGIYYGLAGDADVEFKYTIFNTTFTEKDTINFNDDAGLYLEVGLDIMISEMVSIDLGVRYERGLKYVYSEDDVITDVMTRALLFNGGLCFLL